MSKESMQFLERGEGRMSKHHYEIPKTTTRYGVQFQDARIPLMEADLISKTNQIDSLENKNLLLRSQLAGEQVLLRQAEARVAELERVLRMVEWMREETDAGVILGDWCPWCGGSPKDGHAPDCPRQKVLGGF